MFFLPSLILGMLYWGLLAVAQVAIVWNRRGHSRHVVLAQSLGCLGGFAFLVFVSQFNDVAFAYFGWPVLFPINVAASLFR